MNYRKSMKKVQLSRTSPEQKALLQALASDDLNVRLPAYTAMAEFITQVAQKVIEQAETLTNWYVALPFDANQSQTIPLDALFDLEGEEGQQYIRIWSQTQAGNLATNVPHANQEVPFQTYPLNSAISFDERHLREGRVDWASKALNRALAGFLNERTRMASENWLGTLAQAEGDLAGTPLPNVIRGEFEDEFRITDLNRLWTLMSRLNTSWYGGTPASVLGAMGGITDIAMSPKRVEDIRNMAFNPLNNKGTGDIEGTENLRNSIYNTAGIPGLYGVNIVQFNELDVVGPKRWASIFETAANGKTFEGSAFDKDNEELILAVDASRETAYRPYETNAASGLDEEIRVRPDNQFFNREEKVGFYMGSRQGNIIVDTRGMAGLIIGEKAEEPSSGT